MEGTIEVPVSEIEQNLNEHLSVVKFYQKAGPRMRKLLSKYKFIDDQQPPHFVNETRQLAKASELARQFRAIKHDPTAVRTLTEKHSVEVPLVFRTKLPARHTVSLTVRRNVPYNSSSYKVTAKVPRPPDEALKALALHREKFDWMEVWWVPKDVHVTEIRPDPILIGTVAVGPNSGYHFELHRWVDESVESAYWASEGY